MKKVKIVVAAALGLALTAASAMAATDAGVTISNTASANYTVGSTPYSVTSSTSFKVAQIVNLSVTNQSGQVPVAPNDTSKAITFKVSNDGNATDNFILTLNHNIAGDSFDPTTSSIFLDTTGDGFYNTGDLPYSPGAALPIAAGKSITVFVLSNIPASQINGNTGIVQLQAQSEAYNNGPIGKVFPNGNTTLGTDVVLGVANGYASGQGTYIISSVVVSITKTSSITDPYGGTSPVPGAIVTYSIVTKVTGTGTATGLKIVDPVPTNTTYKTGSIKLGSLSLSDAAGDDAGDMGITTPNTVTVSLGDVPAGAADKTVTFQVTIN
ncbi:hypothetical protein LPW11_06700 [Geomonas sp. RF6]|uniref:hypothetical protein n=1 Tax=Geomonas sp. RF6 TaxID=2897342 RepID=UPI001E4AEDD4|nr:hypothetical protein [Geomonas sp. RF6]UFS71877.1 hypothetical protein LPW11_06700 [Geomonas sp. RF6]